MNKKVQQLYKRKGSWKLLLLIGGAVVIFCSLWFTQILANKIKREEQYKIKLWVLAHEKLFENAETNCDVTLHDAIITSNTTIPVIVEDPYQIPEATNYPPEKAKDTTYLKNQIQKFKEQGQRPIENSMGQKVWFKDSALLNALRYLPFIQIGLIALLIWLGYLGFSSSRRNEQNRIWAGLAKETAHQLGTPISGIIAWVELLKANHQNNPQLIQIANELQEDTERLELIADRFSKIGSSPILERINIIEQLNKVKQYMERRAPRRVRFEFPSMEAAPIFASINPHLFDWVIENLIRNALDAMDGAGTIKSSIQQSGNKVIIEITDTGKGIPSGKFKTIFQPGYSTKTRGWGIGLSLAKRIIKEYHNGKIYVKQSIPGKETTFVVQIPAEKFGLKS